MKTTTLRLTKSVNRSHVRLAILLIPLVCFAFPPQARGTCQQGCLTNNNTVFGDDALLNNKIRIGTSGTQKATFVAGISGVTVPDGVGVIVGSDGKLGTVVSSKRYKDAIEPMDKASEAILALRPVTYRYKPELDPQRHPAVWPRG